MAKILQPSFSSGEIAPGLQNRVDLALYQTALKQCRNFYPLRLGGVTTRPGTQMVSPASRGDATSRLIRFVYSRTQSYLLEFCAGRTWVYRDGARVTESALTITGVTATVSLFTVTTAAHGYVTGDVVQIVGATGTGEIDHLNGVGEVTVTSSTTFTLGRLTTGTATWTSGGTVARCVSVATPYTQDELATLRVTQSADVMTVVHRNHPPHELKRLTATSFSFAEHEYKTGPLQRDNKDKTLKLSASAETGTVTLTATGDMFVAGHVGSLIRLDGMAFVEERWIPESPVVVGDRRRYGPNAYVCSNIGGGVNTGTVPPEHTEGREKDGADNNWKEWEYLHSGYGVARITAVADARTATALVLSRFPAAVVGGAVTSVGPWTMTGDGSNTTLAVAMATSNISSDYEVTFDGVIQPPDDYTVTGTTTDIMTFATAPGIGVAVSARQLSQDRRTTIWSLGAWSEVQGYPGAVTYFANRLAFGGTTAEPQRLDVTKDDGYDDFESSVPVIESDPFDRQLGGRDMSAITDLVPLTSLLILSAGGAHRLSGGDQDTITPMNAATKQLDSVPAADVPATLADRGAAYLGRGRTRLYDMVPGEVGGLQGSEISLKASHLLSDGKLGSGHDFASLPEGILWVVRDDGKLLSLTYLKEQDVIGWAWHETDGTVEQVCVVPEDEADTVYLLVKRTIKGLSRRFIEVFQPRNPSDSRDIFCVDCGLTYDGRRTDPVVLVQTGSNYDLWYASGVLTAADVGKEVWLYGSATVRCLVQSVGTMTAAVQPDIAVPPDLLNVTQTSWGLATQSVSGLTHLPGRAVAVQIDGGVHAQEVVSDAGTIALDVHAVVIHAGLPFDANIRTLPINVVGGETVRVRQKTVNKVAVLVTDSQGIEAGPDAANLQAFEGRDDGDQYELPAPYTGAANIYLDNVWEETGEFEVWQRNPAPMTIVGVIPNVVLGR